MPIILVWDYLLFSCKKMTLWGCNFRTTWYNEYMKNTIKQIADTCRKSSDSKFVQSMKIMDELKKAGLENSVKNNKLVQAELDK